MGKKLDLVENTKFSGTRYTFIREVTRVNPKLRRGLFRCDCGNEKELDIFRVRHLNSTSCGCFRSELVAEKNTKHGNATREKKTGAYRSWQAMHQRVKVNPLYKERNICERWSGDKGFENFVEDMGERPKGMSLERKDNDRGYEPENCKWATKQEQAQNTSMVVRVSRNGVEQSIAEWCRALGTPYATVKQRRQRGMSLEDALFTPLDKSKQNRSKCGKSE